MPSALDLRALTEEVREIAAAASREVIRVYETAFEVHEKDDASPVTEADVAAEEVIVAALQSLTPDIPIVAEKAVSGGALPDRIGSQFWLVDPLDGTREFISRNGEFTVNIALIAAGEPVLGVVQAPARGLTYGASGPGEAWRERDGGGRDRIAVRAPPDEGLTVVASRSHRDERTDRYLEQFRVRELVSAGSSLKLCMVAEGSADLYPRLGRTMEWDIAAGHAVLRAAGGTVTTLDGEPLTYGKPGLENPDFVAQGRRD